MRGRGLWARLAAVLVWLAAPGAGAAAQESAAFVVTLGTDTITVERFLREGDTIFGELLTRYYVPATMRIRYWGTLDREGIRHLTMSARPARPTDSARIEWALDVALEDTIVIARLQGDSADTLRVPTTRGTFPFVIGSFGLMELATRQARADGRERASISYLLLPGGGVFQRDVKLRGDSATLEFIRGTAAARIDREGRLLGLDGDGSTYKVEVERLLAVDLDAFARRFVAQDSADGALGVLSPRDSVQGTIGTVSVRISYGRPKRRGRQIMGGVIPWNTEWRTGANEPTTLELSGPLRAGDIMVPAGRFSVATLPTPSGVTLILQREGAAKGEAALRVPMHVEKLDTLVEHFTIDVVPGDRSGRIEMSWERTRWVVTVAEETRQGPGTVGSHPAREGPMAYALQSPLRGGLRPDH